MHIDEGKFGLFGTESCGVMYVVWASSVADAETALAAKCGGRVDVLEFFNTKLERIAAYSDNGTPLLVEYLNDAPAPELRFTTHGGE